MNSNINYWSDNKKSNNVNAKLPNCSAKDYFVPSINKILTKIKPDSDDFIPVYSNKSTADLRANIPEKEIQLRKGGNVLIDCGFSLEMPPGYKISVSANSDYVAKGIYINNVFSDNNRIRVLVINNSEDVCVIKHKDIIAQIYIEPIYFFEWEFK